MRQLLIIAAACVLGACETMPEFLQSPSASSSTSSAAPATASAAPAASSSTFNAPPDRQLLELERQLSAAAQERGLGGALASAMDPYEGIVIRPGETYATPEAVQSGLTAPANSGPMYWQPDRVHVADSGDMGVTSGRYVQVVTGAEAVQGRYLVVWRRDDSGVWKILTETRIPDPPRRRR